MLCLKKEKWAQIVSDVVLCHQGGIGVWVFPYSSLHYDAKRPLHTTSGAAKSGLAVVVGWTILQHFFRRPALHAPS